MANPACRPSELAPGTPSKCKVTASGTATTAPRRSWPSGRPRGSDRALHPGPRGHVPARAERHQFQPALAVANRISSERQEPRRNDDDRSDHDRVGSAHDIVDMPENPPGIGDQMGRIAAEALGPRSVDIERGEMALDHAELRVHHPEQVMHLRRHPIGAPADYQHYDAAEGQCDQAESPGPCQRHHAAEAACAGRQADGEQDAGEQRRSSLPRSTETKASVAATTDDQRDGRALTRGLVRRVARRRGCRASVFMGRDPSVDHRVAGGRLTLGALYPQVARLGDLRPGHGPGANPS